MPGRAYLPSESWKSAQSNAFEDDLQDGMDSLDFTAALPKALRSLKEIHDSFVPLPVVISPAAGSEPLGSPAPAPQADQQGTPMTPETPRTPGDPPPFKAEDFTGEPSAPGVSAPDIPAPEQSPNGTPITAPTSTSAVPSSATAVPRRGDPSGGVEQWSPLIAEAAKAYNVPEWALKGLMEIESGGRTHDAQGRPLRSSAGAIGLMQTMPFHYQPGEDPDDPRTNIFKGAKVYADALRRYGDPDKAAAAYFGAIDANGNVTSATDGSSTDGHAYVRLFREAASKYRGAPVQNVPRSPAMEPVPGVSGPAATAPGRAGMDTLPASGPPAASPSRSNGGFETMPTPTAGAAITPADSPPAPPAVPPAAGGASQITVRNKKTGETYPMSQSSWDSMTNKDQFEIVGPVAQSQPDSLRASLADGRGPLNLRQELGQPDQQPYDPRTADEGRHEEAQRIPPDTADGYDDPRMGYPVDPRPDPSYDQEGLDRTNDPLMQHPANVEPPPPGASSSYGIGDSPHDGEITDLQHMYRQPLGQTSVSDLPYDPRAADEGQREAPDNGLTTLGQHFDNGLTTDPTISDPNYIAPRPAVDNDPGGMQALGQDAVSTPPAPVSPYDNGPPDATHRVAPDTSPTAPSSPLKPVWDQSGNAIGYVHEDPQGRANAQQSSDVGPVQSQAGEPDYVPQPSGAIADVGNTIANEGIVRPIARPISNAIRAATGRAPLTPETEPVPTIDTAIMNTARSIRSNAQEAQTGYESGNYGQAALGAVGLLGDLAPSTTLARQLNEMLPKADTPFGEIGAGDVVMTAAMAHALAMLGYGAVKVGGRVGSKIIEAVRQGIPAERFSAWMAQNAERVAAADARMQPGVSAPGTLGVISDNPLEAGRAVRGRVVPPDVADTLDFPVRVPDDPAVVRAIEAAGGSVDPERGITLGVTRAQSPEGHGATATRGAVFYEAVPEGGRSSYQAGPGSPVGGTEVIPRTETRFRSPLILEHPPGDSAGFDQGMREVHRPNETAVRAAQDEVDRLQGELESLNRGEHPTLRPADFMRIVDERNAARERVQHLLGPAPTAHDVDQGIAAARRAGPNGSPLRAQALKDLVTRYGGDPSVIDELVRVRGTDHTESAWAIKENILAHQARAAKYDGVVTVQPHGPDNAAVMAHPQVVAAEQVLKDATATENSAFTAVNELYRAGKSAKDPEYAAAWQTYEQASTRTKSALIRSQDAEQRARQELSGHKITELMDPREARNPTPGAPNPRIAELKRTWDKAEREVTRANKNLDRILSTEGPQSEADAAHVARQTALDNAMQARNAYEQTRSLDRYSGPLGYTLRSDIPRRGGETVASASAGTMPRSERGPGALAAVNRAISEPLVGSVGGAVIGAGTDPEDPQRGATRGALIGAAGFPLGSRALRGGLRAAGVRGAEAGGARISLGDVPPSQVRQPGLPGIEHPPYTKPNIPDVSETPNTARTTAGPERQAPLTGTERIDPLTDPTPFIPPGDRSLLPSGSLATAGEIVDNVIRQEQAQAQRLARASATSPEAVQPGQVALPDVPQSVPLMQQIRAAVEPWERRLNITRYAGMLSDTATHAFNLTSNMVLEGIDVAATPIAAAIDVGRAAATGTPRQVFFSEAPARVAGMRAGAKVGLQNAAEILRTGLSPVDAAKQLEGGASGIASGNAAVDFAFEAPLRALAASDAVFRTSAQGGHLAAEGMAAAMQANPGVKITPDMLREAMKDPALLEKAQKLAARTVLQEERQVTAAYQAFVQRLGPEARLLVSTELPFVKTPYNVIAQGVGLTPAGLLGVVQDMAEHKPARDIEYRVARVALGTAVMAGASADYASGNLTGPRPTDPKELSTLPPGWQPWSQKIPVPGGGTYYLPLMLLGPLALPAVAAILMGESAKKGGDLSARAGRVALGVGQYASQNTFFQSLSNIGGLLDQRDAEHNIERNVNQVVSQFSPHIIGGGALGREIQQIMGMPMRDPQGALEALLATHPLTAGRVEPRQDVLGRSSVPNASGPIRILARIGKENDAGVIRAFRGAHEGLPLAAPKQIHDATTDQTKTLTPSQQHRWRRVFGQALTEGWNGYGNPRDVDTLQKVESDARTAANETVLGQR